MFRRPPAVAGTFYEDDPKRLLLQLEACLQLPSPASRRPFIAAVVPHAGLMYSGGVAGAFYGVAQIPKRLIILCPNHTGLGERAAINLEGSWATPLGEMMIDVDLARALTAAAPLLVSDSRAHAREHSLEVQLPFLQKLAPSSTFVPICLTLPRYQMCRDLGEAIATVIAASPEGEIGILASSDLNHYENQATTMRKDGLVIDRILDLDPEGLWNAVLEEQISMCGVIPTTTMLVAAKRLGAAHAELIEHSTSGDVNGDYNAVVGYASILISRAALR
ncbi:MAG TPA: AmmeMemoRadiSam system protein B [Thermoanaerobaculia bacterium]|nr:AmmeMemoRadiSam system protein B [Thermoanaerobaculia bacterium]